ncbi:DUF3429 domain-containing protein [Sphingomonas morindae]|uniref:DUF3429 domain-containing protein n=1 Tax=Sphingomonas morindae TaxID=1541170 RepID=A0ABY4X5X2_9SPHN|nr:DUF3429 domain-containing protein [Sphingomonas morindae]USI72307.1 DUF3429 domain-containing protein [Sphingomonas morindae]
MSERRRIEQAGSTRVPLAAAVLGGLGLAPPAIALLVRLLAAGSDDQGLPGFALVMGLSYIAIILSFLGGLWWGLAARDGGSGRGGWYGLAVVPSLWAFAVQGLSGWAPRGAALMLALGLVASLLVDRRLVRDGLAPRWWLRLRVPLSCGLAALTVALAALL